MQGTSAPAGSPVAESMSARRPSTGEPAVHRRPCLLLHPAKKPGHLARVGYLVKLADARTGGRRGRRRHPLSALRRRDSRLLPWGWRLVVTLKAGRHDRDRDHPGHGVVHERPEDDVGVGVHDLVDGLGRLVDLLESHVGRAGHREDHAARLAEREVEEGRGYGRQGRVLRAGLALARADAQEGGARVLHHRVHVGKVHVDQAGLEDDVRDAHDALAQDVVRHGEGLLQREVLGHRLEEAVVGHHNQRVHLLAEELRGLGGGLGAAPALEGEGLGDHAHGEAAHLLGHLGHHGRGARARAAAHAGRHKHQIGAADHVADVVAALEGRLHADLRGAAGAEAAGHLGADGELVVGLGLREHLRVGVDRPELDARVKV
mmetsp:Transcript_3116/g.10260  ORF Transcript_3116/g.10260 Transcript_3116/m.10260 type:complete len:375 (+) Transcript_3116:287-1411(+)